MRGFDKGSKFGGNKGGDRGGYRGGRGNDRGGYGGGRGSDRPGMHKAVCNECRSDCEVPFKPVGNKPIFCSRCFKGKDNAGASNFRDSGRGGYGDRDSKPRFENKKSYHNDGPKESVNYKVQFEILNTKLDKILKAMTPLVAPMQMEAKAAKQKAAEATPKVEAPAKKEKKVAAKKTATKKVVTKKVVTKKTTKKADTKKKKK